MLRATPNMTVIRPADASETVEAWRSAIEKKDGPTVLALTRQKLAVLDRTKLAPAEGARRGGYVLLDCKGAPEAIVIATGSEVHPALSAVERLQAEGKKVRLVSLPSWELFEAQPEAYRESVLPQVGDCPGLGRSGRDVRLEPLGGRPGCRDRTRITSAPRPRRRCCLRNSGLRSERIVEAVRKLISD